jgi:DNA-binding IclR family transcriptional regulator
MARKANPDRLRVAARLLSEQPGHLSAEYARRMGCPRETFNRLLVQLDDRGFLLSEDPQGRLWPFRDSLQK